MRLIFGVQVAALWLRSPPAISKEAYMNAKMLAMLLRRSLKSTTSCAILAMLPCTLVAQPEIREHRVSSDQISSYALIALAGTRIQLDSHRKSAPPLVARVFEKWPDHNYKEMGCPARPEMEKCKGRWVNKNFWSYVQWGDTIKALMPSINDVTIPFYRLTADVPGPGTGEVELSVNNLHSLISPQTFTAKIEDGKLIVEMQLDSAHRTIMCSGSVLPCPDTQLDNMRLSVSIGELGARSGEITYDRVETKFRFNFDINNVPGWLESIFQGKVRGAVEDKITSAMRSAPVRSAIARTLRAVVERDTGKMCAIAWARIERSDLVVGYVPDRGQVKCLTRDPPLATR